MESIAHRPWLRHLPMFRGLNEAEMAEMARLFKAERAATGAVICREGEPADAVFVVLTGAVQVVKKAAQGDAQVLAELKAPNVVGEMALLDRAPRSATVVAKVGADLYRINCREFDALRQQFSPAAYKVVYNLVLILCERLRETNGKIEEFFANPERSLAEMRARKSKLSAGHG